MNKKAKNPLYVVKGDQVEPANNIIDLLVKKFNLGPVIDFFNMIFKILLENVKSYAALEVIIKIMDDINKRLMLFKNFSIV